MFKTLRQKFAGRASSEASGAAAGGARNPVADEQAPSDLLPVAADAASGRHLPPPPDPSGPNPSEEAAGSNEAGAARFAPAPRAYLNAASEAAREMLLSARARALPRLADARADMREALFVQKLEMASVVGFCWEVPAADAAAKNAKREVLSELVEFLGPLAGQKVLTEATYKSAMDMVSANVFRSLPAPRESIAGEEAAGQSSSAGEGGDESENFLEPAWTHLQLVYEFFLRFILSNEVKTKSAKKFLDTNFCSKLIELFESEDPRERDYLKVRAPFTHTHT
jgi:serine/threonine-protein phosphatase 2A regulatory subunit B'